MRSARVLDSRKARPGEFRTAILRLRKTLAMPLASLAARKKRARQVVERLKGEYPDAECALVHDTPFELLIATILSAQCTDERVNIVTKDLFAKYPTPAALAAVPVKQLE